MLCSPIVPTLTVMEQDRRHATFMSWVPNVVPMSTAESENNCYSVAAMRTRFIAKAVFKILFDGQNFDYTVPICVDSQAAIQMNESDNPTRRTRHIEAVIGMVVS